MTCYSFYLYDVLAVVHQPSQGSKAQLLVKRRGNQIPDDVAAHQIDQMFHEF